MFRTSQITDHSRISLSPETPLVEVLSALSTTGSEIALVVEPSARLLTCVTLAEIRRAAPEAVGMEDPLSRLLAIRADDPVDRIPHGVPRERWVDLLRVSPSGSLPRVDAEGRAVEIVSLEDLLPPRPLPLQGVIMAGGFGRRLHPLTEETPKPMLPVAGRPVMELIVERMRLAGIERIHVAAHYLADQISAHFGDGARFGIAMNYLVEDQPLGTAGALRGLAGETQPLLVVNGDVLAQVDYAAMLGFHRRAGAALTVAVKSSDVQVPFGVVECEGDRVSAITEKPLLSFRVSAGVYIVEPPALLAIPEGARFDMPDLIGEHIDTERGVAAFPLEEYWLDIGRHADYQQADRDRRDGKI